MRRKKVLFAVFCGVFGVFLAMAVGSIAPVLWGSTESEEAAEYKLIVHQTGLIEPGLIRVASDIASDSDMLKNYILTGESVSLIPLEMKIDHWVAKGYELAHLSSCAHVSESEIVYTVVMRR